MLNNMERLNYNGTKRLPEVFSEQDINRILNQILISEDYWKKGNYKEFADFFRRRDLCLIATIYIMGLRPKEACCLKFSDINLRTATIKIRGKNNKTGKDRVLPIPYILIKFFKFYFKLPKNRFWKGSKYLFPSFQGDNISPERLKGIFREKVLKPLGLWQIPEIGKVPKIRLYTLRHSRATHILNKQIKNDGRVDLYAIANFLGHSDLRSTQIYLHTDEKYMEYLRNQVEI